MKQSTDLKIKEIKKRVRAFMGIQIASKRKLSEREKKVHETYVGKNEKP
tara:strand:+ start:386 stop:532 length:147 start_codon:yes stop_codon:yes gene_type:complete